ncbi:MAG: CDP-alcohol phosphatidyltransferase family protein [Oscillospiraceae bacterium]|nr:CDP-alcohol phosphatidyltransferase family protein [Oscillospiraceae bacterium]
MDRVQCSKFILGKVKIIKYVTTLITIIRIIGSIFLLAIRPLSILFYAIYFICGISDILDGYIARKTNTASKIGAALDSIADFVLVTVMLVIFIPIISWKLWLLYWIAAIAIVRLVSLGIGFVKYHTVAFLHTYANKATGIALFCFPLFYHVADSMITAIILCSIASLSAAEELLINLKEKNLNRNIRGLFYK